ncbi:hypothetical protein [Ruminococcus sp. XPD3002]|uniref:hypothetical protein n=1 Tax=Ruminococcus sp. XPD3002 TaxID=1452269 RepID=UPI0009211A09|nr:hypothetical protein [Ruminococcus sp.]MBR6984606.1 hypothetical protein [Ruminococcus sp.]SFX85044.1 hypothetical protein SAMN04487832_11324 [Ruminococcus flavefaciens]
MSRFDPRKLYIVQMLYTSSSPEAPVSAQKIADYLVEKNIRCDEETVLYETELLQSSGVPILCAENNSKSFYIKK